MTTILLRIQNTTGILKSQSKCAMRDTHQHATHVLILHSSAISETRRVNSSAVVKLYRHFLVLDNGCGCEKIARRKIMKCAATATNAACPMQTSMRSLMKPKSIYHGSFINSGNCEISAAMFHASPIPNPSPIAIAIRPRFDELIRLKKKE